MELIKKIAVIREDGGVSIVIPSHESTPELIERDAKRENGYIRHFYIDDSDIPSDRYFRDAWFFDGERFHIDINKAKNIHLNKLREIRKQKFIDLGFPQKLNPQIEDNILDDETRMKLKSLRDFPKNLDLSLISDTNELKNMIPDILK